ncbi:hypothetical protein [Halobacillus mangrovi]|uniref:Uncharacterized protein n=1 Tax=Halobacillus mangrovi TaxID=402384 RepID=A0A1W5ZV42_9BACI|nr:hypothetical protein [Halobacillus mangrovi]ARI77168.1 hypothetical protein HM131_10110 [Halobacillus mangrovi]
MKKILDFLEQAAYMTKNPLGIIGLFISFIYAVSALVLTLSEQWLTLNQTWALVWFIVLFPILILIAFLYLVINHHQKLYSPSDYKDESNFFRPLNPEEQNEKFEKEAQNLFSVSELVLNDSKLKEKGVEQPTVQNEAENLNQALMNHLFNASNFYFLIEESVLRALESDMNITIRRQMALDTANERVNFSGIAFQPHELIGVEIKYTPTGKINEDQIESLVKMIQTVMEFNKDPRPIHFILSFVSDQPFKNEKETKLEIYERLHGNALVHFRFYLLDELRKKS